MLYTDQGELNLNCSLTCYPVSWSNCFNNIHPYDRFARLSMSLICKFQVRIRSDLLHMKTDGSKMNEFPSRTRQLNMPLIHADRYCRLKVERLFAARMMPCMSMLELNCMICPYLRCNTDVILAYFTLYAGKRPDVLQSPCITFWNGLSAETRSVWYPKTLPAASHFTGGCHTHLGGWNTEAKEAAVSCWAQDWHHDCRDVTFAVQDGRSQFKALEVDFKS